MKAGPIKAASSRAERRRRGWLCWTEFLDTSVFMIAYSQAGQVGGLQRVDDLLFGLGGEVDQWRTDGRVLEHAAGLEAQLEGDCALHVGATVVDGLGDRQHAVVHGAGGGIVLRQARLEQVVDD